MSTWVMKKKIPGALRGRINVGGCHQVEGENNDGLSINAPVMNAKAIKMCLTLMIMQGGSAYVVDVKRAFLYGKFEDGEKVYIKVLQGYETFYDKSTLCC